MEQAITTTNESQITFSNIWKLSSKAIKGHWGGAILAMIVQMLISYAGGMIPYAGIFSGLLLFPLTAGLMLFFLRLVRGESPKVESVFEPFRQYGRMLWAYLRVTVFVFLHFLLLIIPGYVAILRYSQTYYIMLDNPEMPVRDAMIASRDLMYGHKWQLFGYSLLLGLISIPVLILTLGIGLIWYLPFCATFCAEYYQKLIQTETAPTDTISRQVETATLSSEN